MQFFYWLISWLLLIDAPENTVITGWPTLEFRDSLWVGWRVLIMGLFLMVAFASVVVLYWFERISLATIWRVIVVGLMAMFRTAIIFTLFVLLFFKPVLIPEFKGERTRPFVVLIDHTQSMKQADKRMTPEDRMRVALAYGAIPADKPLPVGQEPSGGFPTNPERQAMLEAVLKNEQLKVLEGVKQYGPVRVFTFGDTQHLIHDESAADLKRDKKEAAQAKKLTPQLLIELINEVNENPPAKKEEGKDAPPAKEDANDPLARFGKKTAVWDDIFAVLQRRDSDPPAGILLITDGVDNASRLSIKEVAARCAEMRVPLYVYGIGSAEAGSLRIKHILSPDVLVLDDKIAVTIRGRAQGLKPDTKAELILKLDDKQVAKEDIVLQPGQDFRKDMSFELKKELLDKADVKDKERKLSATVKLVGNDLIEPHTKDKNVQVVDRKVKVLYIENVPRWEYKYIQQSYLLRDRRVEPKFLLLQSDPLSTKPPEGLKNLKDWPYLTEFPNRKDFFEFDLVILGDVPVGGPNGLDPEKVNMIRDYVSVNGGALIHIAGQYHAPSSWANTPLAEVLPVEFDSIKFKRDDDKPLPPYVPMLTEDGERSEMLALAETQEKSLEVWTKLPALPDRPPQENAEILKKLTQEKLGFYWHYPVKGIRAGATSLMAHPKDKMGKIGDKSSEKPMTIMATQYYGKGPVLFIATDETWRWRANANDREVARLWGQIIYEMGMPHVLGGGKRVQISLQGGTEAVEGSQGNLYISAFTKDYKPYSITDDKNKVAKLKIKVEYLGNEKPESIFEDKELEPVPGQLGQYRVLMTHSRIGRYRVHLTEPEPATFDFTVNRPEGDEREPSSMAEDDLKNLAKLSTGTDETGIFYRLDKTALDKLKKDGVPDSVTKKLHNLKAEQKASWAWLWYVGYAIVALFTLALAALWLATRHAAFMACTLVGVLALLGVFAAHQVTRAGAEMKAAAKALQEDEFKDEDSFVAALNKRLTKGEMDEHKAKLLERGKQGEYPGKFYREENLHKFADDVQPRKATFVLRQEVLLFTPAVLIALILAFGVEWLIRKLVNLT